MHTAPARPTLLPVQLWRAVEPCCQHFAACAGDHKRVLKLRTALAICSRRCPAVWPCDVLVAASIDHGLYSEDVAFPHDPRNLHSHFASACSGANQQTVGVAKQQAVLPFQRLVTGLGKQREHLRPRYSQTLQTCCVR